MANYIVPREESGSVLTTLDISKLVNHVKFVLTNISWNLSFQWNSGPDEVQLLTTYKTFRKKIKCGLSTPTTANTNKQACCNVLML